jgi:hypothetical protein
MEEVSRFLSKKKRFYSQTLIFTPLSLPSRWSYFLQENGALIKKGVFHSLLWLIIGRGGGGDKLVKHTFSSKENNQLPWLGDSVMSFYFAKTIFCNIFGACFVVVP